MKSLPNNFQLCVKEHPGQNRDWREISFYKKIIDLPNVYVSPFERLCTTFSSRLKTTAKLSAKALKDKGAKDVYVYITHAVLSGEAVNKIEKSQIKKLITTDTIDNSKKIGKSKKIEIISIAPMNSEAMKRIANSTSVSSLFK